VPVQHGKADEGVGGLLGAQDEIIRGEVEHDRLRRRPLARLWSSPGRSHGAQVIDTEPGLGVLWVLAW
jgi:hypothetical protein